MCAHRGSDHRITSSIKSKRESKISIINATTTRYEFTVHACHRPPKEKISANRSQNSYAMATHGRMTLNLGSGRDLDGPPRYKTRLNDFNHAMLNSSTFTFPMFPKMCFSVSGWSGLNPTPWIAYSYPKNRAPRRAQVQEYRLNFSIFFTCICLNTCIHICIYLYMYTY